MDTERGNLLIRGTLSGSAEAILYNQIEELMAKNARLKEENAFLHDRLRALEAQP